MNLVAFTSDTVSVFHIIDEMKQRPWYVQPQLGFHGSKENIRLSINPASVRWVDDLIADLEACVEKAKTMPPEVSDSVKQTLAAIDPATFSNESLNQMLGMAGIQGTNLPERMAGINEMLNALPAELSEKLLTEFLNELMVYRGA